MGVDADPGAGALSGPVTEQTPTLSDQPHGFRFTGSAAEYFRIWIVNLLLTIVTLGIYSAWAKVRKRRYFYGNTWLAGCNFDYHGDPAVILKGRVVAVGCFVAYGAVTRFVPSAGTVLFLALLTVAPWMWSRSLAFTAANSSYRNLRFRFQGRYRDALWAMSPLAITPLVVLLLPATPADENRETAWLLGKLSLSLAPFVVAYPWMVASRQRFRINGASWGFARFATTARVGEFYAIYLRALAGTLATGMAFFAIGWMVLRELPLAAVVPTVLLLYVAVLLPPYAYAKARVTNLVLSRTTMEGRVRLVSTLSARRLATLYGVNLLAISCSFGLLVPWAAVRTMHYRACALRLEGSEDLESFFGPAPAAVGAAGGELSELFDVGISM